MNRPTPNPAPEAPFAGDAPDRLTALLQDLRENKLPRSSLEGEVDRLFNQCALSVSAVHTALIGAPFPIHRKHRQLARSLQKLLATMASILEEAGGECSAHTSPQQRATTFLAQHHALRILSWHLLTSYLSATPATKGIWQLLHTYYARTVELGLDEHTAKGVPASPRQIYYTTVLLGCAQPSSFNSREIAFVADYLEIFSDQTDTGQERSIDLPAAFWLDTTCDAPATACARKRPPAGTTARYFSCERITELLKNQIDALDSGIQPAQLGIPEFAATSAGQGVLRRLLNHWGNPGKRRFPRRRLNYRVTLCTGLDNLWPLLCANSAPQIETSSWMIVNESPDGYALMHILGSTGQIAIGDIAAIRTETGNTWQICIVRWVISENQEHVEIGLQIIAPRSLPAQLIQTDGSGEERRFRALLLPEIPALRSSEMLVVPSGTATNSSNRLFLIIEKDNLEIREIRNTGISEQNGQIEVFRIDPDYLSD